MDIGNPKQTVPLLVLCLICFGIGGYLLVDQETDIRSSVAVEATVTDSSVYESTGGESNDPGCEPRVKYEYRYEGERYTSSGVYPTGEPLHKDLLGDCENARSVADRFEEGKQVTAYVQPDDPEDSFLIQDRNLVFPGVAILFGLMVALALWADLRGIGD